jgi:drug/metabolite transporter (DMT)-like permease
MFSMIQIGAIVCVLCVAFGQVLFRASALALNESGSYYDFKVIALLVAAFGLYAATCLGWVLILQKTELGKIYPFMALSFIVVPLASYMVFGERFGGQYYIGVVLILSGVIFCTKA